MDYGQFIEWNDRYSVGIELIDEQHRELFSQMNNLYLSCQKEGEEARVLFSANIRLLLRYISYHFSSEEKMLKNIKYPDLAVHSQQHSALTKIIAERIEQFDRGDPAPLSGGKGLDFIKYLRDILISHVAILDRKYASYIHFVNRRVRTYIKDPVFPTKLLG
ncbi:MAG: bacteriohemerythrin [Treponema sp.]|jgi:hemerythrin-like metal-binding protein|nr:bacteriohemerythrin [Treponema sp.]